MEIENSKNLEPKPICPEAFSDIFKKYRSIMYYFDCLWINEISIKKKIKKIVYYFDGLGINEISIKMYIGSGTISK